MRRFLHIRRNIATFCSVLVGHQKPDVHVAFLLFSALPDKSTRKSNFSSIKPHGRGKVPNQITMYVHCTPFQILFYWPNHESILITKRSWFWSWEQFDHEIVLITKSISITEYFDHHSNILQTLEIISKRKKVSGNFFAIYRFGT